MEFKSISIWSWIKEEVPTNLDLFFQLYKKHSDLRRVILELQETVGKGGFKLLRWEEEIDNQIDFLNNFENFKREFVKYLMITGNIFLYKLRNSYWKVIDYQFLDPRQILKEVDDYWEPVRYFQKTLKWNKELKVEDVKHIILEADADNPTRGLSIMEGLTTDILADNEAMLTNYYFFKNNAIPWSLITLKDEINQEEQETLIERMKKLFSWWKNKHKVGIISWVEDIKQIQQTMKDMQFEILRKFTTEKICAAYWVPKVILNYTDWVNYTNADIQYTKYIENTIRPLERFVQSIIQNLINEDFDKTVKFEIIDKHINDFKEKIEALTKLFNDWILTINEVRKELWFEEIEQDEANVIIINNNKMLLDDLGLSDIEVNLDDINKPKWDKAPKK